MDAQYSRRDRITSRTVAPPSMPYGSGVENALLSKGEIGPKMTSGLIFRESDMSLFWYKTGLRLIAVIQCTLGIGYLLFPMQLLATMQQSLPPADMQWPLGMLAARFLAYGAGFWIISHQPAPHRLWIQLMAVIQLIDFGVELMLLLTGTLQLSHVGVAMFNAIWIGLFCWLARPAHSPTGRNHPAQGASI